MLSELSYIYITMYFLDLHSKITNGGGFLVFISCIISALLIMSKVVNHGADDEQYINNIHLQFKWLFRASYFVSIFGVIFLLLLPSKDTIKAYIGVVAVQKVGTYIATQTDLTERGAKTLSLLWDRVDGYLVSIEVPDDISIPVLPPDEKK